MKKILFLLCLYLPYFNYAGTWETVFIELNEKVRSSVVSISMTREEKLDFLPFFGYSISYRQPMIKAEGSGFIIDKEGHIITNAHVVHNMDKIQVRFYGDEKLYTAQVLGSDPNIDIALLKVKVNKKLTHLPFGNSDTLQVGQWVATIGNPHTLKDTMTKGIISAVKREIDDLNLYPLIQTDASVNVGNSGGPLVNLKGQVVGVNQAIIRGATGLSFAIPINNVKEVLPDLKSFGFVRRGFIGVKFRDSFIAGQQGVVVQDVIPGSPAAKAGLQFNDRIVEFAEKSIKVSNDLLKAVRKAIVGRKVPLKIVRDGKTVQLFITPQLREKRDFPPLKASSVPSSQRKLKIKGHYIKKAGFQIAFSSARNLSYFNLPDLGAKHPLVIYVKPGSPAHKGGLMVGDLLFQINGQTISKVTQVERAIEKGTNQLKVLRYHPMIDQYLLMRVNFFL